MAIKPSYKEPFSLTDAEDSISVLRGQADALNEYAELTTAVVAGGLVAQQPGTTHSLAGDGTPMTQETWHDTGSLQNGWSKGGAFRYKMLALLNVVFVYAQDIVVGTDTDGTAILSAANGLPSGYRPSRNTRLAAWCDQLRQPSAGLFEACALEFETDGSVQCYGVANGATRVDCFGILSTDA